jgi:hypothetical protein
MAKKEMTAAFIGQTVRVFGEKLWEHMEDVCLATKCGNTDAKPLASGSDAIKALKEPGLYYQQSDYGLQLVCLFKAGKDAKWGYASIAKDKEGDPMIDEEHVYDVANVKAVRSFTLKGETTPLFLEGFTTTKAYPAS